MIAGKDVYQAAPEEVQGGRGTGVLQTEALEGQDEGVLGGEGQEEPYEQRSGEDDVDDAICVANSPAVVKELEERLDQGQAEPVTLRHEQLEEEVGAISLDSRVRQREELSVLPVAATRAGRLPDSGSDRALCHQPCRGIGAVGQRLTLKLVETAAGST